MFVKEKHSKLILVNVYTFLLKNQWLIFLKEKSICI